MAGLFLAGLATAPFAQAGPAFDVDLAGGVSGAVQFMGTTAGSAELAGVYYRFLDPTDAPGLFLEFTAARVRLVNSPYTVEGDRYGPTGWHGYVPQDTETLSDSVRTGNVHLADPSMSGTVRLLPRTVQGALGLDLAPLAGWSVAPVNDWRSVTPPQLTSVPDDVDRVDLLPVNAGARLDVPAPAALIVTRPVFAYLYGGIYEFVSPDGQTERFDTGERLNAQRTVTDPDGRTGVWWYDRPVLIIEADEVVSLVDVTRPTALVLSMRSMTASWTGDLSFAAFEGQVGWGGQASRRSAGLLHAIGAFEGGASYADASNSWTAAGPATFLGIDGFTVAGDREAHLSAVLAVAGVTLAALALALLAKVTGLLRLAAPLFTRLSREDVMSNARRSRLLDSIRARPQARLQDLVQEHGLARPVVRYHLLVLQRHGLVDRHVVWGVPCYRARSDVRVLGLTAPGGAASNAVPLGATHRKILEGVPPEGIRLNHLLKRIQAELGISKPGAWKAVNRAGKLGLVRVVRTPDEVRVERLASS